MVDFPLKIPVLNTGGHSRLFAEYVGQKDSAIRELLGGFTSADGAWDKAGEKGRGIDATVLRGLITYNQGLDARDELLAKLQRAGDGGTRFIVTGQQPGVLGGPLLTLHKIFTALELASWFERKHGCPCVPLFWMGADDADFHEIRDFFTVTADLSPLATRLESGSYVTAAPVGDIPAEAVRSVFESLVPFLDAYPAGEEVKTFLSSVLNAGADLGELTARLISNLADGKIAVVDGRDASVRESARRLFLEYFDDEEKIKAEVARRGKLLEKAGYHGQLSLGPDSGIFQLEGGRRKKITAGERTAARARMETCVGEFSPGVVLRNLIQDFVFDPVAVVLGPAEIAYRAQTIGLNEVFSLPVPVVFPRMTATYLPPPAKDFLEAGPGIDTADVIKLITQPVSFARAVYDAGADGAVVAAAAELKRDIGRLVKKFLDEVSPSVDAKLQARLTGGLADLERRLERVIETAGETGKTRVLARWPFLERVADIFNKNEKPQDRTLSMLTPFFFGGLTAARASISQAAASYVAGAVDGDVVHVVYSM